MALDGTYRATIELGGKKRTGTLEIVSSGDTAWLTLNAPVLGRVEAQGSAGPSDTFAVSGNIRVLLKRISYSLQGRVEGDTLFVDCETNLGNLSIVGTRIA